MPFPTSAPWDLIYFVEGTIDTLLSYEPLDLTVTPSVAPYFAYSSLDKALLGVSADGTDTRMRFSVPLGTVFTWEVDLQIPDLPKTLAMDGGTKLGIGFSNGTGFGATLAFSDTGLGFGPGSLDETIAPLPDTLGIAQAIKNTYYTIRVAVDHTNGRAYVYINPVWQTPTLPLFVLPLPASDVPIVFEIFAQGTPSDVVAFKLRGVRVSPSLETLKAPPKADAGPDRILCIGQTVRFDGRASSDPEQDDLTYYWSLKNVPAESQYGHEGLMTTVDDGDADGVTDTFPVDLFSLPAWLQPGDTVRVQGLPPVVITSINETLGTITVDQDTLPDDLVGEYYQFFRQSFFLTSDESTAVGLPDVPGIYRVELVVNDGLSDSDPVEVIANVIGSKAPFGIEPDVDPIWQAIGDEWSLLEGREFFTEAWRGAAQLLGGRLLEAWQRHYNYSVLDVQDTFQRKWVPFQTFTAEPSADDVVMDVKYGRIAGSVDISGGVLGLSGTGLEIEHYIGGTVEGPVTSSVVFSGEDPATIVANVNAVLNPLGGAASVDATGGYLVLESTAFGFTLLESSTSLEFLGLTAGEVNAVHGAHGLYISDYVYRVDPGVDLSLYSISEDDLLVLGGSAYRILRVLSDTNDTGANQRLLLKDPITRSASSVWGVPSTLKSSTLDFSSEGAFPGDVLKFEVYDSVQGVTSFLTGDVLGAQGSMIAANLHRLAGAFLSEDASIEFLGFTRRTALLLPDGVVSVPQLQDVIPVAQDPTVWRENLHYTLDPVYFGTGEDRAQLLQFRNSVFVVPNEDPPDIIWAEYVHFDNNDNIEGRFGRLSGLLLDAFYSLNETPTISYKSAVSGLLYAQQRGPLLESIRVGAQVLFGQPFAEVTGVITDIQTQYSQTHGRVIVADEADEEYYRTYRYLRDDKDPSLTSGLDNNPRTGVPWAVGDTIEQFEPVGAGVTVTDYLTNPSWFVPRVLGSFSEIHKVHTYAVEAQTNLVSFGQLGTLVKFLDRVSPTHKKVLISAIDIHEDLLPDVEDESGGVIYYEQWTSPVHTIRFMLDHWKGDGTAWVDEDDGPLLDEYLDSVVDLVSTELQINWGGGAFSEAAFFPAGVANGEDGFTLVDVDGAYGPPNGTVVPTYNDPLLAGNYTAQIDIKTSGLVLP